jgi:hypothetical protein
VRQVAELGALGGITRVDVQKTNLESFFGAQFTRIDSIEEMRFEAGGMRYRLQLHEQRDLLFLTGDARDPDSAFPPLRLSFIANLLRRRRRVP